MKKVGVLTDRPGAVREQEEMNFCVLFVFPLNFCDMSLRWGEKKKVCMQQIFAIAIQGKTEWQESHKRILSAWVSE